MNVKAAVKAGTDLILSGAGYNSGMGTFLTLSDVKNDNYAQQALMGTAKNLLYQQSRGQMEQLTENNSWRILWVVGDIVLGLLIALLIFLIVRRELYNRKQKASIQTTANAEPEAAETANK